MTASEPPRAAELDRSEGEKPGSPEATVSSLSRASEAGEA